MKRLVKKSEIFDAVNLSNDYFEVYKNPTSAEAQEIKKQSNGIGFRGILCNNGDIYAWSCDILHDTMLSKVNVPKELHFAVEYNTFQVYLEQGQTAEYLINTIKACKSKLEILDVKSSNRMIVNYEYYGAKKYPVYEYIERVSDIYNITETRLKNIMGG